MEHVPIAEDLIRAGASTDKKDKDGRTALMWASHHGFKSIVDLLINTGVDLDIKDNKGKSAIDFAEMKGHKYIVELIKQAKLIKMLINSEDE